MSRASVRHLGIRRRASGVKLSSRQHRRDAPPAMPRAGELLRSTPSPPILSSLSSATSASLCSDVRHPAHRSRSAVSACRWFRRITKSMKPRRVKHLADRAEDLRLDDGRGRPDGVDVALVELAEPSARWTIGAPHRLNLIALEELRQLVLILRDDAREWDGQVVAEREVRLPRRLVLAAAQDLENELVAFLAVLAEQRLDVLERRRLERLEPVAFVHVAHDADDVLAPASSLAESRGFSAGRTGSPAVGGLVDIRATVTGSPCSRGR